MPIVDANLPDRLAARLEQPLPGWRAQVHYQPELSLGRHRGPAPATARQAAVLVVLYPRDDAWHVPLMLRPLHMPDHAGQVSLPGGMIEPGETPREAALREYTEELGASSDELRLLGELSPLYLFASNFQITPWVAAARTVPEWRPAAARCSACWKCRWPTCSSPPTPGSSSCDSGDSIFAFPAFAGKPSRSGGPPA